MTYRSDDEELDYDVPMFFSFGSPIFPGLTKVGEESSELGVVIWKMAMNGGATEYWAGRDLRPELFAEMADLRAAIDVFIELNTELASDERSDFHARVQKKRDLFLRWHAARKKRFASQQNVQNALDDKAGQ